MANIGILSLALSSHLHVAMSLAKALEERGHRIIFFNVPDTRRAITGNGFRFVEIGTAELPEGTFGPILEQLAKLQGEEAFSFLFRGMPGLTHVAAGYLPALLRREKIDALVIDQLFAGGATVAQHLNIPFASLASALLLDRSDQIPSPTVLDDFEPGANAVDRYQAAWDRVREIWTPWTETENVYRKQWGLELFHDMTVDSYSNLAQISQEPKGFDFPRADLPEVIHYVGPLHHPAMRRPAHFPLERLNGKPLVYAALGTLQNGLESVFRTIMDACKPLNVQLVISTGGSGVDEVLASSVPANAMLVRYAPQFEILGRAALCITHAGLNTVLECLTRGVPMVAIPITHEQPGIASRIRYTRCGKAISLADLNVDRLRESITEVLADPVYRQRAQTFQRTIASGDALRRACEIIECDVIGASIPGAEQFVAVDRFDETALGAEGS